MAILAGQGTDRKKGYISNGADDWQSRRLEPHIGVGHGGGIKVAPLCVDGHEGPLLPMAILLAKGADVAGLLHIACVRACAQDDAYLGV